jgi:hypothetical protein
MKKLFLVMMLFVSVSAFSSVNFLADIKDKSIIGEWIFEVSDAPYGYEKGSLIFSEKDDQTVCTIKLEAGELAVSNLKIEKDKVTFTTYVDGNPINAELILENNKLTGKVDSPEGPKNMTATKKE